MGTALPTEFTKVRASFSQLAYVHNCPRGAALCEFDCFLVGCGVLHLGAFPRRHELLTKGITQVELVGIVRVADRAPADTQDESGSG